MFDSREDMGIKPTAPGRGFDDLQQLCSLTPDDLRSPRVSFFRC